MELLSPKEIKPIQPMRVGETLLTALTTGGVCAPHAMTEKSHTTKVWVRH